MKVVFLDDMHLVFKRRHGIFIGLIYLQAAENVYETP